LDNWQQLWDASILYGKQSLVDSVECFILDHMCDIVRCLGTFVHELESKFKERSMEVHLTKLRELQDRSQECRVEEDCVLIIAVNNSFGAKHVIPCYCESTNSWMELTRMPAIDLLQHVVVTVASGLLYFTGGSTKSLPTISSQCHCFDVASLQWRPCASMTNARINHSAVAVGRNLLVMGGLFDKSPQGEMYNAVTDQWTQIQTCERLQGCPAGDMVQWLS
jgi:hypothetical protein